MTNKLQGKVALITGASAGIGQACARALAGEAGQPVEPIDLYSAHFASSAFNSSL